MLVIAVLAGIGRALTSFYVEVLWQSQAGYASVFWRRVVWEWGTQVAAGLGVAVLVFLNLRIAATTLGVALISVSITGFFRRELRIVERLALGLAGLLVILPPSETGLGYWPPAVGVAMALLGWIYVRSAAPQGFDGA